ncbi:MAG TPA: hypothetical protein VIZ17_11455 [Acetobacteraceae bacterium]
MRSDYRAAGDGLQEEGPEVVRRLLAVATVLGGKSRTDAVARNGIQRQMLRD